MIFSGKLKYQIFHHQQGNWIFKSFLFLCIASKLLSSSEYCDKEARFCEIESHMAGQHREVVKIVESVEQDEGVGARVRRSVGRHELRNLDPFLMLDEFKSPDGAGGFPDHPHRGFETVTYMLKGKVEHEDFEGHRGVIGPGDLQWMTAGRGIVHCEMPHGKGLMHGLQLWVNLAAKDKMIPPAYQELLAKDIPEVKKDGVKVRVIAGTSLGTTSPVYTRTPTMYLDFTLSSGAHVEQPVPRGWTGFSYVLEGQAVFGSGDKARVGPAHHTLVFSDGDVMRVENKEKSECRLVMVAGKPLKEPIVQHGPFVMNTEQEIHQAMSDYRYGKNGFEKARTWNSFVVREGGI